jgi:hypothetical protein
MSRVPIWMFCCDPGLVSGVALLNWSPEVGITKYDSFEGTLGEVGEACERFMQDFDPTMAEIVVERFTITARTAELGSPDWSLKVCGEIEWLIWKHWGRNGAEEIHYQAPGDAKKLVPNPVLKRAGVWHVGGAGHANDALRHGVYRYARCGVLDAWDDVD